MFRRHTLFFFFFFFLALAAASCAASDGKVVTLPDGSPGIGFDDLQYSATLHRVIVPGGRAGKIYLIDPDTREVTSTIAGFGVTGDYSGGHDNGPTSVSVDEARQLLFVTDRTTVELSVVDLKTNLIVGHAPLATSPDYVRFVAATNELWVSEPAGAQAEIFALDDDGKTPRSIATVPVENGPESLVIDSNRNRAYTNNWQATTIALDLKTREIVGTWPNGCAASRGIEIEPEHGFVLVACNEGTVTVLDPSDNGKIIASLSAGSGYDVMGYARATRHVYVAGFSCGCLTVVGLSNTGTLRVLGRFDAPSDTHCVVADDRGHAWVCSPSEGAVRQIDDPFPSFASSAVAVGDTK